MDAILLGTKCYLISIKIKLIVFTLNSVRFMCSLVLREACFCSVLPTEASVHFVVAHSRSFILVHILSVCRNLCM